MNLAKKPFKPPQNLLKTMSVKRDIRQKLFGPPVSDFSGAELPNEGEIFRVYMWCEENFDGSPSSILDKVTSRLRDHCQSIGKTPQSAKTVKGKVKALVQKAEKFDKRVDILQNQQLLTTKKMTFRRIVDIEEKGPKVKRVSLILKFNFLTSSG